MDFLDWLKLGLALFVVAVGLILMAAWALIRINVEDDWK